jgi:hypothetical protein
VTPAPTIPPTSACEDDDGIPKKPGDQVPRDGAGERAEYHGVVDEVRQDQSLADGVRDFRLEAEIGADVIGREIEEARPQHGVKGF